MTAEQRRLEEARERSIPWKEWGPYLSERQWGTVREDYSEGGDAWNYFTHDQARSRAYRWGEDGLAGISDDQQRLCFALALWNGKDPILKERLFGLTNSESNHGEDVKEYYFYLDSTPTHSYMKYLYKYPQAAFPYGDLVETSRRRGRDEFEYELLDTGVFDEDRYFDVFVEYAKESPEDILDPDQRPQPRPGAGRAARPADALVPQPVVLARQPPTGRPCRRSPDHGGPRRPGGRRRAGRALPRTARGTSRCCSPRTRRTRSGSSASRTGRPYVKDSINNFVVHGQEGAVNPEKTGTKAAAHYRLTVGPGECRTIRLRLSDVAPPAAARGNGNGAGPFGGRFDEVFQARRAGGRRVLRRRHPALARRRRGQRHAAGPGGMLWTKQFYHYDVDKWLEERGSDPFKATRKAAPRNDHWHHMYNGDVISMPDKWEYPWYAAWDLAFHVLALTLVDPDFGKQQLKLMLRERYMHPNGQIPAYEWNFGDVNPPVHAWSTIFTYRLEKAQTGEGDREWLKSCFQKLLLNFTWWVNRKDRTGRNVFEGGFLGLDNIGVFDRSAPLPTGGYLEQADGTAWMALFCQNMLEIAVGAGDDRSGLRGHGPQVRRALPVDRLVDGAPGRATRACGTRRTASSTTCSGCPTARRSGSRSGRWSACCRCARPRRSTGSCWRSTPNSASGSQWFLELAARALRRDPRPEEARRRRPPARLHPGRDQAPPRAGEDARRERVPQPVRHPLAVALPRRPPVRHPRRRPGVPGRPTCRPSPTPACSAATRTGAARSGCRSTP